MPMTPYIGQVMENTLNNKPCMPVTPLSCPPGPRNYIVAYKAISAPPVFLSAKYVTYCGCDKTF